jgi:hypothetical protein
MAFTDLPEDWSDHPITDPALLPDILDLFVSERSRATGALYLLICDPSDRLVLPMCIDELDDAPAGPPARAEMLAPMLAHIEELEPDGAVLAALARPGGLSVTPEDRVWADALASAAAGRLRLLGVHLVTPDGSRPVPREPRAA